MTHCQSILAIPAFASSESNGSIVQSVLGILIRDGTMREHYLTLGEGS
jgi:hypothetical protein